MRTRTDRRFNRIIVTFMALMLAHVAQVHAQGVPIGALPNATTPLTGSETTILSQNGTTAKTSVTNLIAPGITIATNRILGNVSGVTATATGLTASQVDTMLALGTAAFVNTGTSGGTVPFLNGVNTWSGQQTFSGGVVVPTLGVTTLTVSGTSALGKGSARWITVDGDATTPVIATSGGNLGLAPTGGIVAVTGGITTTTSIAAGSTLTAGTGLTVTTGGAAITGHVTLEGVTSTGATGTGNLVFSIAPTLTGHPTIEGVTSTGATGTGNFVFSASPTLTGTLTAATSSFSGHMTVEGVTSTGAQGTGAFVFATSPTLTTPVLGVASGTSLAIGGATIGSNGLAVTGTANISGTSSLGTGSTDFITVAGGAAGGTLSTNAGTVTLSSGGGASTTLSDSLVILSNAGYHSCGQLTTNSSGNIVCSAAATYIAWGGIKTLGFTAVANTGYCVDTLTSGAVTMTLPLSPADGDKVQFIDCKSNFATANLTVARNGKTIMQSATDMTVNTTNASSILTYNSSTTDWRLN